MTFLGYFLGRTVPEEVESLKRRRVTSVHLDIDETGTPVAPRYSLTVAERVRTGGFRPSSFPDKVYPPHSGPLPLPGPLSECTPESLAMPPYTWGPFFPNTDLSRTDAQQITRELTKILERERIMITTSDLDFIF